MEKKKKKTYVLEILLKNQGAVKAEQASNYGTISVAFAWPAVWPGANPFATLRFSFRIIDRELTAMYLSGLVSRLNY